MERLFFDTFLMEKYHVIWNKIKRYQSLYGQNKGCFTMMTPNTLNLGVLDPSGELVQTPHRAYIDNNIYLDIADHQCFKQATAPGIRTISY